MCYGSTMTSHERVARLYGLDSDHIAIWSGLRTWNGDADRTCRAMWRFGPNRDVYPYWIEIKDLPRLDDPPRDMNDVIYKAWHCYYTALGLL